MKRLLVIEDQPQMRRNLATILEMEGFEVLTAVNGRLGVEQALSSKPDLIICDVMMPELDGYGVLKALRADKASSTIPFIFLTAKGEKIDQRTGMNLGADDYLTKPVARTDLLTAIRVRLERRDIHEAELVSAKSSAGFNPNFDSPKPWNHSG
jgi:DNA-binding response OmpR family regulator